MPWRNLGARPVVIELSDVYLEVRERPESQWEEDAASLRTIAAKRATLASKELEQLSKPLLTRQQEGQEGRGSSWSLASRLGQLLLNRLKLSVKNVHFKFQVGFRKRPFSVEGGHGVRGWPQRFYVNGKDCPRGFHAHHSSFLCRLRIRLHLGFIWLVWRPCSHKLMRQSSAHTIRVAKCDQNSSRTLCALPGVLASHALGMDVLADDACTHTSILTEFLALGPGGLPAQGLFGRRDFHLLVG